MSGNRIFRLGKIDDKGNRFDPFLQSWVPTAGAESALANLSLDSFVIICCGPYTIKPANELRYMVDVVGHVRSYDLLSDKLAIDMTSQILKNIGRNNMLGDCTSLGIRLLASTTTFDSIPMSSDFVINDSLGSHVDMVRGWCSAQELGMATSRVQDYFTILC